MNGVLGDLISRLNLRQLIIVALLALVYEVGAIAHIFISDYLDNTEDKINHAATERAFNLISKNFEHLETEQQILERIRWWKANDWAAQTGSLKTLCEHDKKRLTVLMKPDLVIKVCRLVN